MHESPFGFRYTWADLAPIRALVVTVVVAQCAGGAIASLVPRFQDAFANLWFGGAAVTFPAFLAGLLIQNRWKPGSLAENRTMVRRIGVVAALITVSAIAFPWIDPVRFR